MLMLVQLPNAAACLDCGKSEVVNFGFGWFVIPQGFSLFSSGG
jgi:hypothetical protein